MQQPSNSAHIKETSKAVWGASPAGTTFAEGSQKGTQEFFEKVLKKRFEYELDWLDEIVDFKRFNSKKVLEIGCGAGYDAYQFCKHGADYTGIDITPDNPLITKKHLTYYGYTPQVHEMDVEELQLTQQYDYVFSFGVLHHTPNIERALRNIYTVTKPRGEIQIIVYHKNSIFYYFNLIMAHWILRGKFLKHSLAHQRSFTEYSTSGARPLVNVYSKREIQQLITAAGFTVIKTDVRKLLHEDLPELPGMMRLYRFIPRSWLRFLGKRWGWYVSVRAIKPH